MPASVNKAAMPNPALKPFEILVGNWQTTGKHPQFPDTVLHGTTSFRWAESGAFLIMQSSIDHEKFPDGIAVLGSDDALQTYYMLYFDERGVSRHHQVALQENGWKWWRNAPGFSQAYNFTFADNGHRIISKGELCTDGNNWQSDLDLTYTRIS